MLRRRLAKNASNALPADELDVAPEVLTKMVTGLRGPSGEILVQSFAMLSRKLKSTPRIRGFLNQKTYVECERSNEPAYKYSC